MAQTDITTTTAHMIVADPEPATLIWHVAPEQAERFALWLDCQTKWLNALEHRSGGINTRRAYQRDIISFFAAYQLEDLMPWQVSRVHVARWVETLATAGLAGATINRKLAALSSLYEYASAEYTILRDGSEVGLWAYANPFRSKSLRSKTQPYGKAVYPSTAEVSALLNQIDLTTQTGWRNLAIIAGLFATTRRVNEWLNLRWGDIRESPDGNGMWFTYRYKGGAPRRQAIPADIGKIIKKLVELDGRSGKLAAGDYLFIAYSAAARHLPGLPADYAPGAAHISASYVNILLKHYGAAAGIAATRLHAHALRHAGARYRKQKGAGIFELRDILGHKSINTTQIYSDVVLENPTDAQGDQIIGEILPKQMKFLFRA